MIRDAQIVLLLSRQRSGSTVFRQFLASSGKFIDVGEVFHDNFLDKDLPAKEERFYGYLLDRVLNDHKLIHPLYHPGLFVEFISDLLRKKESAQTVVLDCKYNTLNIIRDVSPASLDTPYTLPYVIQHAIEQQFPIVLLTRRNKLRLIVSERIAQLTCQWSLWDGSDMDRRTASVRLDANSVYSILEAEDEQDHQICALLREYEQLHAIEYEAMFDDSGKFSASVVAWARAVFGNELSFDPTPRLLRQNPEPLSALIENYDEVQMVLRGTKYGKMCLG